MIYNNEGAKVQIFAVKKTKINLWLKFMLLCRIFERVYSTYSTNPFRYSPSG